MAADTPDPTRWFADLMAAQQAMWRPDGRTAAAPADSPLPAAFDMPWLQAANAFAQWQQQALQQMTSMWSGAMPFGAAMPGAAAPADRRFAADAWRNDPRFDGLTRAYLGQSELLQQDARRSAAGRSQQGAVGLRAAPGGRRAEPGQLPGHQPRGACRRRSRRGGASLRRRHAPVHAGLRARAASR